MDELESFLSTVSNWMSFHRSEENEMMREIVSYFTMDIDHYY